MNKKYYPWFLSWLLFASLVGACSAFNYGGHDIDTTRKAMLVTVTEVRAVNLLLQDLVTRNAIETDDARKALGSLRHAHETLTQGLAILDTTGDPATAQDALTRATSALDAALLILQAYATASEGQP